MLNTYPLWKNLLVVFAISLGVVYALPNIYQPDYAIQISSETSGVAVTDRALKTATDALDAAGLKYFGAELGDRNVLIRLPDDDTQLKAKTVIQRSLHDLKQRYVVALNSAPTTPQWLNDLRAAPMKYGLDLRGGVHFLMEVDTRSVISERMSSLEADVKRKLREEKIRYKEVDASNSGVLKISFEDSETRIAAQRLLESQYREFIFASGADGLPFISLTITADTIKSIEDFAVSQNLQTIRNRVNELGVSEPLVQRLGRNRIVVDLPGVQDTAEAKRILGKVATLEFRLEAQADAPRSTTVAYDYEGRAVNLERNVVIKGERVVDAQVGFDPDSGLPQVNITLDGDGGNMMHRATRNNIGRRLGVVFIETKTRDSYEMVDGEEVRKTTPYVERRVISLATVQAALGVQFRITGLQAGEARELSLLLRAGGLGCRYVYCRRAHSRRQFRQGEYRIGCDFGRGRFKFSAVVHAGLLQSVRPRSQCGFVGKFGAAGGDHVESRRDPDTAGYRGYCLDRGYGGGCECPDFFSNSRGAGEWHVASSGD